MAVGIKTVKEKTGVINWVYDYSEVPKTLSESYPVQVNYSPSNDTEINIDVNLQGVDHTNLTEIKQIVQDKLETILDIVTIDDDDTQIMNTDSEMVNKVLAQDLNSHE